MGESTDSRTTLQFDRRLRLEFHGATLPLTLDSWHAASWMTPSD